jgi:long-subunit acyl-CoA synthetase (AMP-forming)
VKSVSLIIFKEKLTLKLTNPAFLSFFAIKENLERIEIPQRYKLVEETWLPDTGLVTATFKLKRNAIEKFYKSDLDALNH